MAPNKMHNELIRAGAVLIKTEVVKGFTEWTYSTVRPDGANLIVRHNLSDADRETCTNARRRNACTGRIA